MKGFLSLVGLSLGNAIHDLLLVAVFEGLAEYVKFYGGNKEFMQKMNLDHEEMTKKMRILTLISLAEKNPEITFAQIQKELQLAPEEVIFKKLSNIDIDKFSNSFC